MRKKKDQFNLSSKDNPKPGRVEMEGFEVCKHLSKALFFLTFSSSFLYLSLEP